MLRHNLIVYRDDRPSGSGLPLFDRDGWLAYVPIRLPETLSLQNRLPRGAAAVLVNQAHADPDPRSSLLTPATCGLSKESMENEPLMRSFITFRPLVPAVASTNSARRRRSSVRRSFGTTRLFLTPHQLAVGLLTQARYNVQQAN